MKYQKPQVFNAGTALTGIRGQGSKLGDDFDGMNQPPIATASAYDADE